jgi:energy-coupling factor transporter ATP-binding protein EcfA2
MSNLSKKVPLIAVAQIVLSAGVWQWWGEVQKKPLATVLIALLYEFCVLLLALGQKIWIELEKDIVTATVRRIRNAVSSFALGFNRRYKQQVIFDYEIFNVRGLGMLNTYSLKLEHVFVDLRIDPSNPEKLNFDPIARKSFEGNRPIWDFLRPDPDKTSRKALAIIGAPGCGKTTLLQHVALIFASNRHEDYEMEPLVPILLFLRDHATRIARERPTLDHLVQEYFENVELFPTLRPPRYWFARQLKRGKAIVLLDGLDEIANDSHRRNVSRWVDDQIRIYPHSVFILTARPQGYKSAPLFNAHVLEVQPFNAKQVQLFISNWFLANEIISSGNKDNAGVRQRAQRDAKDLLNRLRGKSSLNDLTANPLLLTMITMVHRYRGALPGSRVELYSEICEVLLGRWRQAIGVRDRMQSAQKLMVLRPLANHMMSVRERDLKTAEVIALITPLLEVVNVKGITPQDFLNDLQASSGLLIERELGLWSFAHQTFQEYLTAAHWLEQRKTDIEWEKIVQDSWWSETLRLYAAQGDASELVKACLAVNRAPSLTLAAECLEEARSIDPTVLKSAEETLIGGIHSDIEPQRRLASEVHLSRRIKRLQRIENHHLDELLEIDLEYITCAEYQLFIDDCSVGGTFRQPDHWFSPKFPSGEAFTPVTGVRASDALAFCDWLTTRYGGRIQFRIPKPDEAVTYPAVDGELATWCLASDTSLLVGHPLFDGHFDRRSQSLLEETALSERYKQSGIKYADLISDPSEQAFSQICDLNFVEEALDCLANRFKVRLQGFDPVLFQRLLLLIRNRDLIHNLSTTWTVDRFVKNNDLDLYSEKLETSQALRNVSQLDRTLEQAFKSCLALSSQIQHACQFGYATSTGDLNNLNNFNRELLVLVRVGREFEGSLGDALAQAQSLDAEFVSAVTIDVKLAFTILEAFGIFTLIADLLEKLRSAAGRRDVASATKLTQLFFSETRTFRDEGMTLITEILAAIQAQNLTEMAVAHRRFMARVVEYTFPINEDKELENPHYALMRKLVAGSKKSEVPPTPFQLLALKFHSYLKTVIARQEQILVPCEGVRIVRERI